MRQESPVEAQHRCSVNTGSDRQLVSLAAVVVEQKSATQVSHIVMLTLLLVNCQDQIRKSFMSRMSCSVTGANRKEVAEIRFFSNCRDITENIKNTE